MDNNSALNVEQTDFHGNPEPAWCNIDVLIYNDVLKDTVTVNDGHQLFHSGMQRLILISMLIQCVSVTVTVLTHLLD